MQTLTASLSASRTPREDAWLAFAESTTQSRLFEDRIPLRYVRVLRQPVSGRLELQFHYPIGQGRWRRGQISLWHAEYYTLRDLLRQRPPVRFEACRLPLQSPTDLRCEIDGEWLTFAEIAFETELRVEASGNPDPGAAQFDLAFAS